MPAEPTGGAAAAVAFTRLLRRRGLDVSTPAAVAFAESLTVVGLDRRRPVYWAGRATLVRRPEDVPAFDAAFDAFWRGQGQPQVDEPTVPAVAAYDDALDGADAPEPAEDSTPGPQLTVRFSPVETLRDKDFAACTPDELAELDRAVSRLGPVTASRRSRRLAPAPGRRGRPDPRRTLRAAMRTGGEPIRPLGRLPRPRPRPLVLLVDVSGSMSAYARALLRFAHASMLARRHGGRVEVFTLGTRLTRVTRPLAGHDPDAALAGVAEEVADWSGGTRLGATLAAFNDRWGVRGLARGAVVVILSDGWDRGDPATVAEQMQRLARVAHRVVWVNPLKAGSGYAPLAQGMAAALPHVDHFVEGHSFASLVALASLLAGDGGGEGRAA
jgi:uncharacterized protein with von Willebrand factor type A (vWA) domain